MVEPLEHFDRLSNETKIIVRELARFLLDIRAMPEGAYKSHALDELKLKLNQYKASGIPVHYMRLLADRDKQEQAAQHRTQESERIRKQAMWINLEFANFLKRIDWKNEQHLPEKGYALCCFSQLSYGFVGGREKTKLDRILVFPSELFAAILQSSTNDIVTPFLSETGISFEYFQTKFFVFAIFSTSDAIIVAVRGTASFHDLLIDLDAPPLLTSKKAAYHRGFLNEANSAFDEINQRTRSKCLPIWITGHSLGGAIAAIINQRNLTVGCYTFACPRFANAAGVAKREPIAYVRPGDLVPRLPPQFWGYADASTSPTIVGNSESVPSTIEKLKDWFIPGRRLLKNHSIDGYRSDVWGMTDLNFPDEAFTTWLREAVKNSPNVSPVT